MFYSIFDNINIYTIFLNSLNFYLQKLFFLSPYKQRTKIHNIKTCQMLIKFELPIKMSKIMNNILVIKYQLNFVFIQEIK